MPIEIKELVIRAVVDDTQPGASESGAGEGGGVDTRAIIEEAVRQVLRILKRQQER